jgi:hypothetical protein
MRSAALRRSIFGLLAVALGLQVAAFALATVHCDQSRLLTAERAPSCCDKAGADRVTGAQGDCCKTVVLEDDAPAGSSASPEVPPAPVAFVGHQDSLAYAPRSSAVPGRVRRFYERPPPLASPIDTVVLRL